MPTLFEVIRDLPEDADLNDYELTVPSIDHYVNLDEFNINLNATVEIRKKRKMLEINGIQYPEPERKMPSDGTTYYYPSIYACDFYVKTFVENGGDVHDNLILQRGGMHLNKDAAMLHAKAIFGIKGNE